MGAGKNKSHRKKRISKHVLESVQRKKLANVEAGLLLSATAEAVGTSRPNNSALVRVEEEAAAAAGNKKKESSSRRERKLKLKDPAETSSYLSLWKYDRTSSSTNTTTTNDTAAAVAAAVKQWKFNKNTQSWLLRHMYDSSKVSKTTFTLLLEYIIAGKGVLLQSKVKEDAKFRARRYKEWETTIKKKKEDLQQQPLTTEDKQGSSSSSSLVSGVTTTATTTTTVNNEWKTMDEHEKRKEYKRARKVLDTLKNEGGGVE